MAFSFFERRMRTYLVVGKRKGDKQSRPEKEPPVRNGKQADLKSW